MHLSPVKLENKQDIIPISIHQKPACSKSSWWNIRARISKNNPVERSAIGKCIKSGCIVSRLYGMELNLQFYFFGRTNWGFLLPRWHVQQEICRVFSCFRSESPICAKKLLFKSICIFIISLAIILCSVSIDLSLISWQKVHLTPRFFWMVFIFREIIIQ